MLNRPATMNAVIECGVFCDRLGVHAGLHRGINPNNPSGIKSSQHSFQFGMHSNKWHNNRWS